jgi:hypothetical protein
MSEEILSAASLAMILEHPDCNTDLVTIRRLARTAEHWGQVARALAFPPEEDPWYCVLCDRDRDWECKGDRQSCTYGESRVGRPDCSDKLLEWAQARVKARLEEGASFSTPPTPAVRPPANATPPPGGVEGPAPAGRGEPTGSEPAGADEPPGYVWGSEFGCKPEEPTPAELGVWCDCRLGLKYASCSQQQFPEVDCPIRDDCRTGYFAKRLRVWIEALRVASA